MGAAIPTEEPGLKKHLSAGWSFSCFSATEWFLYLIPGFTLLINSSAYLGL